MWKVLSILAALLAGGAAYLSYENNQAKIQETSLRDNAVKNLASTEKWYNDAGVRLKETADKLADTKDKSDTTAEQLVKVQADEMAAQEELKKTKEQITTKEAELADLEDQIKEIGDIEEAAAKLDTLTAAINEYESSVDAKQQEAQSKSTVVKNTEEKIEDFKNLEIWQQNGKMEGLNASVSEFLPDYNLVVINAGNNRGVVSRAKLDVRRGGDKIGELLVDILQPNRSVCKIASLQPGVTIQAGDRVVVNEESKPSSTDTAAAAGGAAAPTPAGGAATIAPAEPTPMPKVEGDATADPFAIDDLDPTMKDDVPAEAPDADATDAFGL